MRELLDSRCATFATRGLHDAFRNSVHVITSYWAHSTIRIKRFEPVLWPIEGFALVEVRSSGRDYRYETIEAWPLDPSTEQPSRQTTLFH
jgi:hypothetical protein